VCVLLAHRQHGQQLLTEYLVPNAWRDAFLYELPDSPGEGTEVVGVEWVASGSSARPRCPCPQQEREDEDDDHSEHGEQNLVTERYQ